MFFVGVGEPLAQDFLASEAHSSRAGFIWVVVKITRALTTVARIDNFLWRLIIERKIVAV